MLLNEFKYSLLLFPFFLIFVILVSKKFKLVDTPNSRKIHKNSIVNTSGISIYVYLTFIVATSEISSELENIISTGLLIVLIGFVDDRLDLRPSTKLFLTLFPVSYLIFNGFELTDLGRYEYINLVVLGKFSIIFTLLAVLLLINAINYVDGVDGLLIGYTIIALSYFYFLSDKQEQYINIFLILIYILFVSLIFNFLPFKSGIKSFVGDAGSLFIGFFLSFTLIYLYTYKNIHPAYLIWSCWLPVYDFIDVTLNRVLNKINFSNPDKSHLHHYILDYFSNNHFKTFLFIIILNIMIITGGYLVCELIGKIYSLLLFAISFLFFVFFKRKLKKKA